MKVVAIGGSPRLQGHSNYLIDQALAELASRGVETEKIVLSQHKFGFCLAHNNCTQVKECQQKDDAGWILDKYSHADGIIVASPVYFGSISGQIKTFVDRTYFIYTHGQRPQAKCIGLIAIAGGGGHEETLREMKKFIRIANAQVFTLAGTSGQRSSEPAAQTELIQKAREMGRQMAEVLVGGK